MKSYMRGMIPWWDRYALRHPIVWQQVRRYRKRMYITVEDAARMMRASAERDGSA